MNGYFKSDPKLILHGKEELLDALNNPVWHRDHNLRWDILSDFIVDCIDEIVASGKYPYNATVDQLVSEKLGLPPHDYHTEGTPLSNLVYNAQGYRDTRDRKANGYEPLTQGMIDLAFAQKAKIAILHEGYMGESEARYTVKKVGDKAYAMMPRSRTKAVMVNGQPAKIVKR